MRYRALDADGDMTFGQGSGNYLVNTPAAVAQAVATRLKLFTEEWFLDQTEGTPYATQVFGFGTDSTRDLAVRTRILETQGVTDIVDYSSEVVNDSEGPTNRRRFVVTATLDTLYGL